MRSRAAPAYRAGLVGEVARAVRPVVEPVDLLEVLDGLQLGLAVRARARLALVTGYRLEGVQNDLLEHIRSALRDSGLQADRLELEITETVLIEQNDAGSVIEGVQPAGFLV